MTMNLKHNHPFFDGLVELPEGRKKDLQKIKNWMVTQAHLPEVSDEFIYLFLHACYYNIDRTKNSIETWFTIKSQHPSIFSNRDPYDTKIKTVMDMGPSCVKSKTIRSETRKIFVMHVLTRCTSPTSARSPIGRILTNAIQVCDSKIAPKHYSYYIHPEKIKQKIKEKDAYKLCKFFDSPEYKSKVMAYMEVQHRKLTENAPTGLNSQDFKYEHVLSCAQPKQKKVSTVVEARPMPKKVKKFKPKPITVPKGKRKTTALEEMMKKKAQDMEAETVSTKSTESQERERTTVLPVLLSAQEAKAKKKYRQKTTIMPLYLTKMKKNKEQQEILSKIRERYDKNTNKIDEDIVPDEKTAGASQLVDVSSRFPQELDDLTARASTPKTGKTSSRTMGTLAKAKKKVENFEIKKLNGPPSHNIVITRVAINKDLDDNYERKAIIEAIRNKTKKNKYIGFEDDPVISLYERIKTESAKKNPVRGMHPFNLQPDTPDGRPVKTPASAHSKVSSTRLKRETSLKQKAKQNPGFWLDSVKENKKKSGLAVNEDREEAHIIKMISKNLARNYHRQIPRNIVDASGGASVVKKSKGFYKY